MFFLVKLLEESGYEGPRHFDAHALRTEDPDGVWDFARGCMRSYLILEEKAKQFCADREIQDLIKEIRTSPEPAALGAYSSARAAEIKNRTFDRAALTARPLPYERLDQLVIELLMGVRS
jgi:xylose isomerase